VQKRSTHRVVIRPPTRADSAAFLGAVRESRCLHQRWVSPPSTPKAFARYVVRVSSDTHRGYLVIHRRTGNIVGVINVTNIIRGPFQNAFLGYYSFLPHAGQGLMHEGMLLVLRRAFRKLKLHRLEANIQPGNRPSIALVRKCGFVREGFSRRYLKVCGRWADHQRWAILAENFRAQERHAEPGTCTGRRDSLPVSPRTPPARRQ
jgi:[ribosomal protein S5]-alanine N-acetyltransferase